MWTVRAQTSNYMRINEVLVVNESNLLDPYGARGAWIELSNNAPGSIDICGCSLQNDKSNPRMSMIQ